jgi:hypothetical protein
MTPTSPTKHNLQQQQQQQQQNYQLRTYTFESFDLQNRTHLHHLHTYMNQPRIQQFWGEQGPIEHQERYIRTLPWHSVPIIGFVDGEVFGYFECYWSRPDRLECYLPHHHGVPPMRIFNSPQQQQGKVTSPPWPKQ